MSKYWPDGEVAVYSTYYEYCEIGLWRGQFVYRWLHSAGGEHVDFKLADEAAIEISPELWSYIQKYQAGDYEHGLRMPEKKKVPPPPPPDVPGYFSIYSAESIKRGDRMFIAMTTIGYAVFVVVIVLLWVSQGSH